MKKLLVLTLITAIILTSSYIKVIAATEEGIAGINTTLDNADNEDVKTAFNKLRFTKKDVKILYKIVEAECEGQSKEDKQNVTSVIINRMMNISFDNSIKEVVFADEQFSSVDNGRYDSVKVADDTKEAVNEILENGVTTEATYYANLDNVSYKMKKWFKECLKYLFTDDANHSFYIEK